MRMRWIPMLILILSFVNAWSSWLSSWLHMVCIWVKYGLLLVGRSGGGVEVILASGRRDAQHLRSRQPTVARCAPSSRSREFLTPSSQSSRRRRHPVKAATSPGGLPVSCACCLPRTTQRSDPSDSTACLSHFVVGGSITIPQSDECATAASPISSVFTTVTCVQEGRCHQTLVTVTCVK